MGFETNQSTAGSASNRRPIRVLVVDDHALIRDGLTFLIAGQTDMEVVAEAADGREGIEQFLKYLPDVTLMDLRMADMGGTEAIVAIRKKVPDARIVVLTTYGGDAEVVRALQAGAGDDPGSACGTQDDVAFGSSGTRRASGGRYFDTQRN